MEYQLTKEEREFLTEGLLRDLGVGGDTQEEGANPRGSRGGGLSILLLTPRLMHLSGALEKIVKRFARMAASTPGKCAADDAKATSRASGETSRLYESVRKLSKTLQAILHTIETHALIDPLTGMDNLKHFTKEGERLSSLMLRLDKPLSVISFEVDDLKKITGTYGMKRGEELLLDAARVLRGGIRQSDVMTRTGKNRFSILAPNADEDQAVMMAERLRRVMAGARLLSEEEAEGATLSIGVAAMENGSQGPAERFKDTLRRADKTRRGARRRGGNRVLGDKRVQED